MGSTWAVPGARARGKRQARRALRDAGVVVGRTVPMLPSAAENGMGAVYRTHHQGWKWCTGPWPCPTG